MNLVQLRGSLRVRLLLGTLIWIAASVVVAGWGLGSLFRQHVQTQFQAELTSHLDQLTAQLNVDAHNAPQLQLALSDPRLTRPFSGYYWQIDRVADGEANVAVGQLRSRSLWDHVLRLPPAKAGEGDVAHAHIAGPQGEWLNVVERTVRLDDTLSQVPANFRLMAAASERFMLEPVARFHHMMWLALAVLAAGLVVAAVVQVLVGLAPLGALRDALAQVRHAQSQRLEGRFPQEIMPLVNDFNKVLTHNAEVVERARTHAGNLAHALKTPLSVLANAAQGQGHDTSALARLVSEQVEVARKQVNYHLARAQAAAAGHLPGAKTELLPVLQGLVRVMQRIHAERAIELSVGAVPAALAFRGEVQDLQEMLGNLLDNACKWTRHHVLVNAQADQDWLIITIDDDGPGLVPAQRQVVLQRGVRADEQVPGTGLGLAIVDDLARLYGGKVMLDESPRGGLRAVLTLPAALAGSA